MQAMTTKWNINLCYLRAIFYLYIQSAKLQNYAECKLDDTIQNLITCEVYWGNALKVLAGYPETWVKNLLQEIACVIMGKLLISLVLSPQLLELNYILFQVTF